MPPQNRKKWDGSEMPKGTLMLIGDQGFGDTIQFSRFIPEAARRCPNIIMACSAKMRPIVIQQKGVTRCHDRWQSMPEFDAYCALSGLPHLFGTNLSNIPGQKPYVKADPAQSARWRSRLNALAPAGYRRIGLVWAGRAEHGNDFNRSCSLQSLAPLLRMEKTAFISLQIGPAQAEIGRYFGSAPLINIGAEIEDFTDTMAILDGLNRLVAVDTGVAHLAGAMGIPTSILLPYAPDWRWLLNRTDSPWYPSVTLHRQEKPGDWESAVRKAIGVIQSNARD